MTAPGKAARQRYDAKRPVLSFRLTPPAKKLLETLSAQSGKSMREIMEELIASREEAQRACDACYAKGVSDAERRAFWFDSYCQVCYHTTRYNLRDADHVELLRLRLGHPGACHHPSRA